MEGLKRIVRHSSWCSAGLGNDLQSAINMIHRWLGRIGAHIVYLRDRKNQFYVMGVSSLGHDYATSIAALRRLIDQLGARSVHCMGELAGVYGALQMGLDLGAQSVLCLSGPTELTAPKHAKRLRGVKALERAMLTARGRYEFRADLSAHSAYLWWRP